MPWETRGKYIRSGHGPSGYSTCRTISIGSGGIKAIVCKYGNKWKIRSYLFPKDTWTKARAQKWVARRSSKTNSNSLLDLAVDLLLEE